MSSLYAKLYAQQNAINKKKKPVVVVDSKMDDIYNDLNTHCGLKNKKCEYADQFGDCPFTICVDQKS